VLAQSRTGGLSRSVAARLWARTGDAELERLLSFSYDAVDSATLGAEELTFDLSVPDNVTYVANGFVSHNTIGLMMDCDTTGIEPDLGLCKTKKLVGGGTMSIVNQTVPRALGRLGYTPTQVAEIIAYIDEHKSIVGAPHLSPDHLPVFACSMGDNVIHYSGHVRMMGAAQPWISGAISKCVVGETLISTVDGLVRIGSLHRGEAPDTFRDHVTEVASLDGTQKTASFYYGGIRRVHKAVLRSGQRITATPNHRLLVAADGRLDWRRMDELEIGDHVAQQYGADLWSVLPARFDDFGATASYGSQKTVTVPAEMTEELAFLLGAYAAEGHTTRSNWTVTITNSVDGVLQRVAAAWRSEFGVEARIVHPVDRCPGVVVASKTVVEFLDYLGCGARASTKRIPDAVLTSPREMVLAFLQGLALDAYVSITTMPKWAICVDSPALLDDLQAVLTNLGIVHGRISKLNRTYAKTYDEVYATGAHAQRLARLVPFMEPEKAARAAVLDTRVIDANRDTAGVVPGISTYELYRLLPPGTRTPFAYLCDPRTVHVTRRSVERVAAVPGVVLPPWLRTVLDDGLHFSPVASVGVAGEREVFDLSVPATQAFVGNGIVNHNTINMPEDATVEDVEQLHIDAWRLGLKAVAIYRDNCKVAQPLSTTKKTTPATAAVAVASALAAPVERLVDTVVVREPVRAKLPRRRNSKTMSFRVADCHGYVIVGEYDDGRPGEIFLKVAKQGSTLAGIMDAFAISVSHGLQYGVPLRAFVDMYTNMRFEPAGMTDDPDIRFASSLVDYIFRRMAVEYLPFEDRAELGILTVGERTQPTLPGVEETTTLTSTGSDVVPDPAPMAAPEPVPAAVAPVSVSDPVVQVTASDAPYCYQCGMVMQRAGACFVCSSCGTTSGCS
jgi:intein/homing endonuclease